MKGLRAVFAAALSVSVATMPAWAMPAPTTPLGTVIAADRAHVGQGAADVGTTVFGGDRLSTDLQGSIQVHAGPARLLLLGSSSAIVDDTQGAPSAKLLSGTATFSTGNAHAFTLFASSAAIRPQSDAPTIGQVTYLSEKELVVSAKRGGLAVSVDGETQLIAEGTAYRVLMDPQGPAGAGAGKGKAGPGMSGPPLKAGRSRFLIVATVLVGGATYFAISEALESPARP